MFLYICSLLLFLHLGINLAVVRIVTEELTLSPDSSCKKAMKKCLSFSFLLGFFAFILLTIFSDFISTTILKNQVKSYIFVIIAISLPFISIAACLNGYFSALRKNGKNAINKIFEQTVKIISTAFILSLFMPNGIHYACLSLVLGEAISEISSCIFVYVLYIIERNKNHFRSDNNRNYTKRILKISVPIAITSYIRSGLSTLKQLLIPSRLEKSGLSYEACMSSYGLINGMVMPVLMFPEVIINSFSGLLIPEFTYFNTKKRYSKINSVLTKIFRITFCFSVCAIGVFLFYSDKISLFIYNNLTVSTYLKILCPLLLFMYLDSVVDSVLKGVDKQVNVMNINILDLFVSIFCIYFLLPLFGINGYIYVIFISELLNSCMSIFQLYKFSKFKIDFKNWIIKPFLFILISFIVTEISIRNPCINATAFSLKIIFFVFCYSLLTLLFNRVKLVD